MDKLNVFCGKVLKSGKTELFGQHDKKNDDMRKSEAFKLKDAFQIIHNLVSCQTCPPASGTGPL